MRIRTAVLPLVALLTTVSVLAGVAHAADPLPPPGLGDLWPSPSIPVPKDGGTLWERWGDSGRWYIDTDYGLTDYVDPAAHVMVDVLFDLLVVVVSACCTLMTWAQGLMDIPGLAAPLTRAIKGAGEVVSTSILPVSLAAGGLLAFWRSQSGRGMKEFGWLLVSAVTAVTLIQTPQTWVDGVDFFRRAGGEVAMTAAAGGISGAGRTIEGTPLRLPSPAVYPGPAGDDAMRRATDTVARTYLVVPWCLIEFGTLEACRRYGPDVLAKGTDREARLEYLQKHVTAEEVGDEGLAWKQGHRPGRRAGIALVSLLVAVAFAGLMVVLTFGSVIALVKSCLLLVVGPFFAGLWSIPGRLRGWGMRWGEELTGTIMGGALLTLTAGAVMTMQMVTVGLMPTYGWAGSAALSIASAIVAFQFRSLLACALQAAGGGSGAGLLMGAVAARGAARMVGRVARTPGRAARGLGNMVENHHRDRRNREAHVQRRSAAAQRAAARQSAAQRTEALQSAQMQAAQMQVGHYRAAAASRASRYGGGTVAAAGRRAARTSVPAPAGPPTALPPTLPGPGTPGGPGRPTVTGTPAVPPPAPTRTPRPRRGGGGAPTQPPAPDPTAAPAAGRARPPRVRLGRRYPPPRRRPSP
ncbi:hypothetical protein ACFXJO_40450 [Streptomyces lavendulae]|uniref:hypothetical protein n=1 Tax=Streptomyces lavendulae TaxID=1914 RepID=UPI0036A3EA27